MLVISLYFISFLFVDYISKNIKEDRVKIYFQVFVCFILLFGFFGFRELSVLNDTSHYYGHLYNEMKYQSYYDNSIFYHNSHERFEYGFLVWERFISKYIWPNPYSIILITSLIIVITNLAIIKKYTNCIALTVFLLLGTLISEFSAIRQSYAICIFLIAVEFLKRGETAIYFAFLVVAYMFHHSAAILFIIPFITHLELNKANIYKCIAISLIIAVFIYPILSYLGLGDSAYYSKGVERDTAPIAAIINTCIYISIVALTYHLHKNYETRLPDKEFIWLIIIGLCFSMMSVPFVVFGRFVLYFMTYLILSYVITLNECKKKCFGKVKIKYLSMAVIAAFLGKLVLTEVLKNEWHHLTPYSLFDFADGFHNYYFGY